MKRLFPYGRGEVSVSGDERREFAAESLVFRPELSNSRSFPRYQIFTAGLGKDQWGSDCEIEFKVWLDEDGLPEKTEVLLTGSADLHASLIGFEIEPEKEDEAL